MLRLNRFIPALIGCTLLFSSAAVAFAQGDSYTVVTGDSLDKIGAIYDVQVACLAKTNDLSVNAMLTPGQVIAISFDCPLYDGVDFVTTPREVNASLGQGGGGGAPTSYQIQRGDSLDSIGQAFNIPVDAVPYGQFPALTTGDGTTVGQGGGGGAPATATTATDLSNGDATYVVQYQDTLDSIGALFDVKVDCLVSENNIAEPAKVYPGQALSVKTSCPRYDGFDVVIHPRAS